MIITVELTAEFTFYELQNLCMLVHVIAPKNFFKNIEKYIQIRQNSNFKVLKTWIYKLSAFNSNILLTAYIRITNYNNVVW